MQLSTDLFIVLHLCCSFGLVNFFSSQLLNTSNKCCGTCNQIYST